MYRKLLVVFSFIILFTFLFINKSQAQSPLKFGVRGAYNSADLRDTKIHPKFRNGFMVGVYLNYSFSTVPFSLQPELLYTQKGYKIDSITTSLNYIELPVLVNFHLFMNSPVNPKIYVGPYIAFKVRANREQGTVVPDQNYKASSAVDQKFTDRVQDTDFGISVGAEVCITKFSLGIRYNAGLTPIFETQKYRKNNVISITTGIQF